jgi:hypothetical protein
MFVQQPPLIRLLVPGLSSCGEILQLSAYCHARLRLLYQTYYAPVPEHILLLDKVTSKRRWN